MALDAGMIACIKKELCDRLLNCKLEKIHQPEKDQIDLIFRSPEGPLRMALSAAPGNPRLGITAIPKENPATPPFFCILLRKHLASGVLRAILQPGFERMLEFHFDARDEMGFETKRVLICELMGKYSNLILCDESYKILGILRPVDFTKSEKRQLLPGMRYEMPPAQEGKVNPLEEKGDSFFEKALLAGDRAADKFLLSCYAGLSPLTAREISHLATGRVDGPAAPCRTALYAAFSSFVEMVKRERFAPCIVRIDGKNTDYSFFPIGQYEQATELRSYESACALLDEYFEEKERVGRVHQRGQDLFKVLKNAEGRLQRKMEAQRQELAACGEKDVFKQWGDLITANLYALKKGQEQAELINYFSEEMEPVVIALDGRLSPAANAQKYYKKYNKCKSAERELTLQLQKAEGEIAYVYSALDALSRATLQGEIEEIRSELIKTGYLSKSKMSPSKKLPPQKYLEYRTSGGFRVLCGKNNLQNDALTFKVAEKNDWWFHVHGAPGSHVVMLCDGVDDPPAEDFTEAAIIAACNSTLSDGVQVTVDYTKVRNVKKPPAAHPGFVIYNTNYSAVVSPDKDLLKKLMNG